MKKFIIFLIFPIVMIGCASTNRMNSEWKKSIAQLQITPVMPLRQKLEIGEVYRYLRKPKKYYEEGQIEPTLAFKIINIKDKIEDGGKKIWPTFTYTGSQKLNLDANLTSLAALSGNINNNDIISIRISNGTSKRISISDILSELTYREKGDDGKYHYYIKTDYDDKIIPIGNLHWHWFVTEYKRNIIFLRIPTEIYYSDEVDVSISKNTSLDANAKLDEELIKSLDSANIQVVMSSETGVTLKEKFDKQMVIGYRGILLKVWVNRENKFEVEEFPEDSNLEFWSDL